MESRHAPGHQGKRANRPVRDCSKPGGNRSRSSALPASTYFPRVNPPKGGSGNKFHLLTERYTTMSIAAAKRRRRQAAMNNRHVAKLGRRVYKKKSAAKMARRLRQAIEKQRLIALRKGMSKKS